MFLNTTDYHREVAGRIRGEAFNGADIPVLGGLNSVWSDALFWKLMLSGNHRRLNYRKIGAVLR